MTKIGEKKIVELNIIRFYYSKLYEIDLTLGLAINPTGKRKYGIKKKIRAVIDKPTRRIVYAILNTPVCCSKYI